jgi:hypothetical protein
VVLAEVTGEEEVKGEVMVITINLMTTTVDTAVILMVAVTVVVLMAVVMVVVMIVMVVMAAVMTVVMEMIMVTHLLRLHANALLLLQPLAKTKNSHYVCYV